MNGSHAEHERGGAPDQDAPGERAPDPSLRDAMGPFREFKAYAAQYASAKVDSLKLSLRKAVVYAGLGLLALIALMTLVVTGVVFAISGTAQALSVLLGGRAWAGSLIAGVGVLGIVALGTWVGFRLMFNKSRAATVKRYEQRIREQQLQFDGQDARRRSAEQRVEADRGTVPS
jgi:hypothetical protein